MIAFPPTSDYWEAYTQNRLKRPQRFPSVQITTVIRPAKLSRERPPPKNGLRRLFARSKNNALQDESYLADGADPPALRRTNAKLKKKQSKKLASCENGSFVDFADQRSITSNAAAAASVADFRPAQNQCSGATLHHTNSWDVGDDDVAALDVGLQRSSSVESLRKEVKRKPVGSVEGIPPPLRPPPYIPSESMLPASSRTSQSSPPEPFDNDMWSNSRTSPLMTVDSFEGPPLRTPPSVPLPIDISPPARTAPLPPKNPFRDSQASSLASSSRCSGSFETAVSSWDSLQRRETNPYRKRNFPGAWDPSWNAWQTNDRSQSLLREHVVDSTFLSSPTDSGIGLWDEDVPVVASSSKGKAPLVPRPWSSVEATALEITLHFEEYLEQQRKYLEQQRKDEELARALQKEVDELRLAKEAKAKSSNRECSVCGDSKGPLEYAAKPPTATCTHPVGVCKECLEAWLAAELDSKGTEGFKCPECPAELSYNEVQANASAATFLAYDKICTRNALSALPEFAWCLSPNGCNSGQLNVENSDYMHCADCGWKQCVRHRVAWHTGETCAQYDYRVSGAKARDDEAATEKMIGTVSKVCPGKNCGWRIQKMDGCDHMTCKRCKHEFCWQCLASQSEIKRVGNTAHQASCKFHSRNLDLAWPFNVHAGVNRAQEAR